MIRVLYIAVIILLTSCHTTEYYVVRHGEKEMGTTMTSTTTMTTDVPLSAAGKERAEALKNLLISKKIKTIYSTNTIRTKSTVKPLSEAVRVPVQIYNPGDTNFVSTLKQSAGNVLVVGHSNTVDDIVNSLMGKTILTDLPDSQYGDLFVMKRKGGKFHFTKGNFGK